jgi:hypothetical protein
MASQEPIAQPQPAIRDLPGGEETGPGDDATGEPVAASSVPRPPQALLWLNPVVAAADVVCGMDVNPYSPACQLIASVTGRTPGSTGVGTFPVQPPMEPGKMGIDRGGVAIVGDDVAPIADPFSGSSTRDTFWPQAALAWLVTSAIFVLLSVQLVSPTRRWRPPRRRLRPEPPA